MKKCRLEGILDDFCLGLFYETVCFQWDIEV